MMAVDPLFNLSGRRVLITGSSRGIGRALALAFAVRGARLAVHGAAPSHDIDAMVAQITGRGGDAAGFAADLADARAVSALAAEVAARFGGVDILVLNASTQVREAWDATSVAAVDAQIAVNLKAAIALIAAFGPGMRERRWGRILAIGSVQQVKPHPEMAVYAATKAAQENLMRNLARQLAPFGVTCNNLAPGVIATDRNTEVLANEAYRDSVRARIPAARFGTPDDCVGAALMLCSEAGAYVTGVDLLVDGGMHL